MRILILAITTKDIVYNFASYKCKSINKKRFKSNQSPIIEGYELYGIMLTID